MSEPVEESEVAVLARTAQRMYLEGEREIASWAWCRAGGLALQQGDLMAAGESATAGIRAIVGLDRPVLRASLELLLSELAAEVDDPRQAAALWLSAERGFRAVGDEVGFLACWVAAAEHALRGGDPGRGADVMLWILPRLDELGLEVRVWLRLRLAAALAAAGRAAEAVALSRYARDLAGGDSGQSLSAAALAARVLLDQGDAEGCAAEALSALENPDGPPMLRADLFRLAAHAFRRLGHEDAALACDDRAGAPAPAAEQDPPGPQPPALDTGGMRLGAALLTTRGMGAAGGVPGRRTATQYLRPRRT